MLLHRDRLPLPLITCGLTQKDSFLCDLHLMKSETFTLAIFFYFQNKIMCTDEQCQEVRKFDLIFFYYIMTKVHTYQQGNAFIP